MEILKISIKSCKAFSYFYTLSLSAGNAIPGYMKDVDTWFAPFRQGELEQYVQNLRKKNGVSFDAVMSMAANIVIADSIRFKVSLEPNSLKKRWGKKEAENLSSF